MKLGEIAERLGCQLEGDASLEIKGVAGIEEAQAGELTFFTNRKYRPALETTRASAILVARDEGPLRTAALRSANPYLDFARAIEMFHPAPQLCAGRSSDGGGGEDREDRQRSAHRAVLLRR